MAKSTTAILELQTPVTVRTGTGDDVAETVITALEFRRPKAKDFRVRDSAAGDVDAAIRIMARLTGQTVQVLEELDGVDFAEASTIVANFMEPSPGTGET